jgi:hypothetical protein
VSAAYDGLSKTVAGFASSTAGASAAYGGLGKTVPGFIMAITPTGTANDALLDNEGHIAILLTAKKTVKSRGGHTIV